LIGLVIRPSLERFIEGVRQGTLDFTLLKPADAQLLISVANVQIWKVVDVTLGLAVIVVALIRLSSDLGAGAALSFAGALLAGTAIVYSFLLILATCAFWFVRVENILFIFQATYDAGRWPVGIYPRWLRAAMTFLVPVAFAITVPTEGLTGRLEWPTLLGALALAAALLAASRWFWRQGVKRYAGASA
jgi:ABC-2 type transport system permease protein